MKKLIILSSMFAVTMFATAQSTSWNVDNSHSNVKFTVTHLVVSEVDGSFRTYSGNIESTKADFDGAVINFTVDVNSVNTDNEMRDKHLKADDFFNAEKYPQMSFKSSSFKKASDKKYVLEGDLTIKDVTKRVKFDVYYGGTVKDPYGNTKAGFKATSKISRKEFKLTWNPMTEAGGAVVADEVEIKLNLEFAQKK
ncbi:MAG: YceI family protein [Bacteroidota bacterium]|jgi:polyisoprenoid-binding protein YceI